MTRGGARRRRRGAECAYRQPTVTEARWRAADTKIAYCSCTDEPSWADECMRLFDVGDGITLESVRLVRAYTSPIYHLEPALGPSSHAADADREGRTRGREGGVRGGRESGGGGVDRAHVMLAR